MSDYFGVLVMFFLMLFAGFISYLFLKDVIITIAAVIRKDKNTTKLTPWQIIYHVFIGIALGVLAIMLLLGILLYFDVRNKLC
ncbi:MAG: hypothetical protein IKL31_08550 [Ruminococcus sp.]|nr:hypothetical protein [Ruminococcus sp.]MBR3759582.1 hypothetical protein [Ruminococcus sp.]MBR6670770.1 hypothetical protein [Ruminococcus sp.]